MAEYLGITMRQYQRYEKGEQEPRIGNLAAISEFFGLSVDYMLGFTENQERNL